MTNDTGINKTGTDQWVKISTPLELTSEDNATLYTEADAITIAEYLTATEGVAFAPGRPKRKPKPVS
jgi:hypothetical protein